MNDSFTPAQRIAELNAIDHSLANLLAAASDAVGVLANKRDSKTALASYETQQDRFREASRTYFATLSSIEVGLRRQVYALEEAGLIKEGDEKDVKRAKAADAVSDAIAGGGLLDPSWLNARADKSVEISLQRELLSQANDFLAETKTNGHTAESEH